MDTRFLGIAELVEAPSVAVVVDVMRAFTVAAWAFAQGAEKIVLAGSLDEALVLKARCPDWVVLKDGPPAPGFDTVNSPGLLRSIDLAGRTVVQKTTAGTVGALAVKEAPLVLCPSQVDLHPHVGVGDQPPADLLQRGVQGPGVLGQQRVGIGGAGGVRQGTSRRGGRGLRSFGSLLHTRA
ncbi:2-phosphosulfolactate phosphatase [Streptosporangium saharense]|uniref:2-phosphosulfolactate phosphatase n=1 Tax=Streptosporangium saharense TaxID=1706840 RepID=UPI003680C3A8